MRNREKEIPPVILSPYQNLCPFPFVFLQPFLCVYILIWYNQRIYIQHDCRLFYVQLVISTFHIAVFYL